MKNNEIKICGITDLSTANFCIDNDVNYLGFVSYENSPRNIPFKDSKNIIARLLKPINTVAVTVNTKIDNIKEIEDAGFDYIQCHGSESISYLATIKKTTNLKIIKAFGISNQNDLIEVNSYKDLCDFYLFDAKPNDREMPGGNAKRFNWDILNNQNLKKILFIWWLNIYNLEIALKHILHF